MMTNLLPQSINEYSENPGAEQKQQEQNISFAVKKTPSINFDKKNLVLINGSPKLIYDLEAVKQWILLFFTTPKDAYDIYEGTGFGTSLKKLFGHKAIGYGYEEAIVEDEIKEGLLLCPAISNVRNIKFSKENKYLSITVEAELYDGTLITETIEDILKVRL